MKKSTAALLLGAALGAGALAFYLHRRRVPRAATNDEHAHMGGEASVPEGPAAARAWVRELAQMMHGRGCSQAHLMPGDTRVSIFLLEEGSWTLERTMSRTTYEELLPWLAGPLAEPPGVAQTPDSARELLVPLDEHGIETLHVHLTPFQAQAPMMTIERLPFLGGAQP